MNAPRRPDGPPVRHGNVLSAIAHLSRHHPVRRHGEWPSPARISTPQIYEAEIPDGLLIIEDLGSEPVVTGDPPVPIEERYQAGGRCVDLRCTAST